MSKTKRNSKKTAELLSNVAQQLTLATSLERIGTQLEIMNKRNERMERAMIKTLKFVMHDKEISLLQRKYLEVFLNELDPQRQIYK